MSTELVSFDFWSAVGCGLQWVSSHCALGLRVHRWRWQSAASFGWVVLVVVCCAEVLIHQYFLAVAVSVFLESPYIVAGLQWCIVWIFMSWRECVAVSGRRVVNIHVLAWVVDVCEYSCVAWVHGCEWLMCCEYSCVAWVHGCKWSTCVNIHVLSECVAVNGRRVVNIHVLREYVAVSGWHVHLSVRWWFVTVASNNIFCWCQYCAVFVRVSHFVSDFLSR